MDSQCLEVGGLAAQLYISRGWTCQGFTHLIGRHLSRLGICLVHNGLHRAHLHGVAQPKHDTRCQENIFF
jgi:hypothetical protein